MYVPTSLSYAKAAEQLINTVVQSIQSSFSTSRSAAAPSASAHSSSAFPAGDTVTFSSTATAFLSGQSSASSSLGTDSVNPFSKSDVESAVESYDFVLDSAAQEATPEGQSTTMTLNYSSGTPDQPVVTGALAGIVNSITATGTATVQPGETSAEQNFAQLYAAQKAQGVAGRFYNGVDLNLFTSGMSDAEKTSFMTAYNNRTLDIQSQSDTPALMSSGSVLTETLSSQSEWSGGTGGYEILGNILPQNNQYHGEIGSAFFGLTVVSWGGRATSQPTSTSQSTEA